MIARLAGIILPVFLIVALGYAWGRRARPDMQAVNRLSMNLLGPALIFSALASKDFDVHANGMLMIAAVGVVLGSGLIAWPVARALGIDYRTFLPPMMFNNCGNVGLPLAVLAFGAAGFSSMVALFTISNLLHFTVGVWMIDHHARIGKLLRTPMVLATFAGFACALLKPPLPDWLTVAIRMVGDALVPVMLISLGVRLTSLARGDWHLGAIGGATCALSGLVMAAILILLLGLDRQQAGLLFLFGCLPPAVLNFMVAEQFGQEPAKVASIVLIGNLMSLVFVPVGVALALR
ncbi:MAG TPA: AEC family transporter [Casimicrobiaceae bacterium]